MSARRSYTAIGLMTILLYGLCPGCATRSPLPASASGEVNVEEYGVRARDLVLQIEASLEQLKAEESMTRDGLPPAYQKRLADQLARHREASIKTRERLLRDLVPLLQAYQNAIQSDVQVYRDVAVSDIWK